MSQTALSQTARHICRVCRLQQGFQVARIFYPRPTDNSRPHRIRPSTQHRTISGRAPPRLPAKPAKTLSTPRKPEDRPSTRPQSQAGETIVNNSTSTVPIDVTNTTGTLQELRRDVNSIAASERVPEAKQVLEILDQSYQLANVLIFGQAVAPGEDTKDGSSGENASLLSDLEEPLSTMTVQGSPSVQMSQSVRERAGAELSKITYDLLKDPKVDTNKDVLSLYVRIMCLLGRPEYLPEVFFLYANKPVPVPDTSPVQYQDSKPNAAANAIPQNLSDAALDAAILQRDLPLAIAVIDTTVAARAFRRNKFLRKATLPLTAVGSTPLVAYAGAEWLAQWQNTFDPMMSKYMTMMGAMAYIGTLGTIGFIALTTWNDHHDRVVWTPGTPLRQRWSREEERMYFDRIAVAWGFQNRQRRGEEMGEEWEALRDILGERSMILDKSDLMEGMQ